MPREKLDKERRKALREARRLIEAVYQADGNEAETRRRLERIFEAVIWSRLRPDRDNRDCA